MPIFWQRIEVWKVFGVSDAHHTRVGGWKERLHHNHVVRHILFVLDINAVKIVRIFQ